MKYDLLIRDGEVVDPGAGLRGLMDVGIAGGKIV
jgi:N-acyl-D-aspartate/D-glutamate deacylase